uniref:Uncharacterized protein n=1 Tax=Propithecus coquereli TaxID=379532 RepID=A0A2K6FL81_PROCO
MADAGLRRVVPSDLYPLVLGFLQVANKFAKATGATQQDANASSLLDIYSFWLNRSALCMSLHSFYGCSGWVGILDPG